MSDDWKEIEKIQQELNQLSQKQVELSKDHQQKVNSLEKQKTLYQHLFGQPPLQPDPELQAVNSKIQDLKEDKRRLYDILQAAASVPPPVEEKDWSKSRFYSKHLAELGLVTPAEQISTVSGGMVGLGYSVSNFYRSHHLFKLTHCKEKTEEWTYHWARSRATPEQIELASYWIGRLQFRGFAALGAPLLFVFYMWSKRRQ